MTSHFVNSLETGATIEQDFSFDVEVSCIGIRPKLYKHLEPAGTFTISLIEKGSAKVLRTKSQTAAEMKAAGELDDYSAGFILFDWDFVNLKKDEIYTIKLEASGYTFAESAYIGWIKEYFSPTNKTTPDPSTDLENPYSFQVAGYQIGKR
jgi:hypothetical protein